MTLNKKLFIENAHIFTAVLLIIQPILDIISFWFAEWNLPSFITLILRLGVLAITVLYAFLITDSKKIYYVTIGAIVVIYACHLIACLQFGIRDIVGDFSNYIRVVQTPLTAISLITLLKQNKDSYEGLAKGLSIAFLIMLLVMLISTLTGTDPHTYKDGKGVLGWFNNTNSQSSNLCVLLPISLGWQLASDKFRTLRNQIIFWLTCCSGLLAMYVFCTRLAYLGIIATTVGLALTLLIIRRRDWWVSVALLALSALFVVLIPVSPMMRHINNDYEYLNETVQKWADGKIENKDELDKLNKEAENKKDDETEAEETEPGETKPEEELSLEEINAQRVKALESLYRWKVPDFVDRFGLEETVEMYNYTNDVNVFSDLRAKKIMFGKMLMEESPFTSRLFGLELSRFTEGENIYDVENDFHGIYFLYGWLGLIAYIGFVLYFIYLILKALLKDAKKYFTVEAAGFGIAFLVCLAHAYTTAGVLRRPNASVFLAATMAGIYYLVCIRGDIDPKIKIKRSKR